MILAGCSPKVRERTALDEPAHPVLTKDPKKKDNANNSPELQALMDQEQEEAAFKPEAPPGATAECLDDTYSFAKSRTDACKGHRGVAKWLVKLPGK